MRAEDNALDASGERLKTAKQAKPAPPSAHATRHAARMIAVPGLDMLRRVGFRAGAAWPDAADAQPEAPDARGE